MKHSQSLPIVICGAALLAFAGMLKPEPAPRPQPPEATSAAILAILDVWGAEYKLNKHDQVYWLWLKRIPLSDDELSLLNTLPQLRYLNLRGIHHVEGGTFTDAGLQHLSGLTHLEILDLSANHRLTGEGLQYLAGLKKLTALNLSQNFGMTDECSGRLSELTSLRRLNLTSTKFTVSSLPNLAKLRNLQSLKLHCRPAMELTKETIPYFRELPLKELKGIRIREKNRYLVSELRHLEQYPSDPIDPSQDLRDIDLIHYRHIKQIDHLSVTMTNGWSETGQLRFLQEYPHLKRLRLGSIHEPEDDFDAEGIKSLAHVPALRRVSLGRINDDVLAAISHCPQVTILDLTSPVNQISAEGLRSLQRMPNLKALSIPRKVVSDETIEAISNITSLEMLALDGHDLYPNVSGRDYWTPIPRTFALESLEFLNELPNLKILYVDFWGLGDEALEYLSRLENLQSLSIRDKADQGSGIPISEPALLKLRHLPNLKSLDFQGTATSIQAAERLHEFLPDCYITDNWCCGCLSIGPVHSSHDLHAGLNLEQ